MSKVIARGTWQREVWRTMTSPQGCYNPLAALRGRAKQSWPRYARSLDAMCVRAREQGYTIHTRMGPYGGRLACFLFAEKEGGDA